MIELTHKLTSYTLARLWLSAAVPCDRRRRRRTGKVGKTQSKKKKQARKCSWKTEHWGFNVWFVRLKHVKTLHWSFKGFLQLCNISTVIQTHNLGPIFPSSLRTKAVFRLPPSRLSVPYVCMQHDSSLHPSVGYSGGELQRKAAYM